MAADPQRPAVTGIEGSEAALLQGIWREVGDAAGNAAEPLHQTPDPASPGSSVAEPPGDRFGHERLLQSARAVHALNERLQVNMDVPEHRLARDRLTAYVAKVSALSGVRADELVIGSGSDAFVVQNDAGGRTIAKFDTQDAVKAPVGDSLDQLAAASRAAQTASEPSLEQPQAQRTLLP